MARTTKPESIVIHEGEGNRVHSGLDFDYIDSSAAEIAEVLSGAIETEQVAEIAFQPGDGTMYGLVFVPLLPMVRISPRVKDGSEWNAHAFGRMVDDSNTRVNGQRVPLGMRELNKLPYLPDAYLVVSVITEGALATFLRRDESHAHDYVAERLRMGRTSGLTIALLLRAIGHHRELERKPSLSVV